MSYNSWPDYSVPGSYDSSYRSQLSPSSLGSFDRYGGNGGGGLDFLSALFGRSGGQTSVITNTASAIFRLGNSLVMSNNTPGPYGLDGCFGGYGVGVRRPDTMLQEMLFPNSSQGNLGHPYGPSMLIGNAFGGRRPSYNVAPGSTLQWEAFPPAPFVLGAGPLTDWRGALLTNTPVPTIYRRDRQASYAAPQNQSQASYAPQPSYYAPAAAPTRLATASYDQPVTSYALPAGTGWIN